MKKYLLSTILTLAFATNASAAGYQLQEYSVTGLGRSFAGAGVMGDDYSAIAFNPAGMSLVEKSGLQTGVIATDIRGSVKGSSQPRGYPVVKTGKTNSRIFRVMPNFFGQYKATDKLDLGLGLYVPFGLANDRLVWHRTRPIFRHYRCRFNPQHFLQVVGFPVRGCRHQLSVRRSSFNRWHYRRWLY